MFVAALSRARLKARIPIRFVAGAFLVSGLLAGQPAQAQPLRWGDIVGPPTATSFGVHIPTTLAEVASLTAEDEARIYASAATQLPKVRALIETGLLRPEVKLGYARPRMPTSSGGRLMSPIASHMYNDARCAIAWQGYVGSGTMVYGWGQTVSNTTAWIHVYGQIYQNGAYKSQFGQTHTSTVAYGRSADLWVAWWDHPTFVVNSDHWIKYAGTNTYDWGPWYCSVSKTI